MGGLTFRIILWISSAYLFLTPLASAILGGGIGSVCYFEKNRTELRYEFHHEYYLKRVWSFIPWYSYRIQREFVNRTETAMEQICCPGFKNVSNVCLRDSFDDESCRENCAYPQYDDCKSYGNGLRQEFSMVCDEEWQYIDDWCRKGYEYSKLHTRCRPVCSPECKNGLCTEPEICVCPPDYRMTENNKCEPLCDRKCENGECVSAKKCDCNEGWKGDYCEIPLLCTIAKAKKESEFSGHDPSTEPKQGNVNASLKFPVCNSSCFDHINDETLLNYPYIPIDSDCNTDSQQWKIFWLKYGFLVPLILVGIVLLISTICIARCILRKSKPLDSSKNDSIPLTLVKQNFYETDNHLYATIGGD